MCVIFPEQECSGGCATFVPLSLLTQWEFSCTCNSASSTNFLEYRTAQIANVMKVENVVCYYDGKQTLPGRISVSIHVFAASFIANSVSLLGCAVLTPLGIKITLPRRVLAASASPSANSPPSATSNSWDRRNLIYLQRLPFMCCSIANLNCSACANTE